MLKAIRYALAAIFLAASVGCLALWQFDGVKPRTLAISSATHEVRLEAWRGKGMISMLSVRQTAVPVYRQAVLRYLLANSSGRVGYRNRGIHFPLWYAALVFAVAAVAAIRIGRQFTLRSALVGMSVVAVLLGMVATL
ncbi:hypothetical protein [Lacipirellula parvula]|uniref:Uncharacterized protein n=1 Tax=Lacipirellula parvula TaxID=2650471 RepID=A0A5K7X4W1_9BACT|nr:hypothetical protein [Lacipirellula parvula]BBO31588.1 hypothetical protein PLANPX_1200 [Lacipirellula parvula]